MPARSASARRLDRRGETAARRRPRPRRPTPWRAAKRARTPPLSRHRPPPAAPAWPTVAAAQHADDGDRRSLDRELLGQGVAERRHARGIVRAVDHDQRVAADHLHAARHAHRGEGLLHHLGVERRAEEGLRRRHRATRRCPPGARRGEGRARRRRSSRASTASPGDRPPRPGSSGTRSRARRPRPGRHRSSLLAPRRSPPARPGLPHHDRAPGVHDAGLVAAISSSVEPRTSVWSKLTLVSTATSACMTLVESHVPPRPTSTTTASTPSSANQAKAAAVRSSKRVGRSSRRGSSRASLGQHRGQGLVIDRLGVAGEALVDRVEVGTGVGAHAQALRHEQGGDHRRRRALAVGAGHVDRRDGVLRLVEQRGERAHPVERGQRPPSGHAPFEIDVRVEPLIASATPSKGGDAGTRRPGQDAARRERADLTGAPREEPASARPGRARRSGPPRTGRRRCGSAGRT